MLNKSKLHSRGVALLHVLIVVAVLAASGISLCDPNCRDLTAELTFDGVCVGMLVATIRLLHIVQRRTVPTLWSWWCLARVAFGVEMKHGFVGGYLLGITHAAIACVI